ncbi:MAG: glycosyltransferase family 4 protein [bacterium]
MRIIIGTSGLGADGGIGSYVDEIAKWLISQNHEVLVCCASVIQMNVSKYPYPILFTQVMNSDKEEFLSIKELYEKIMSFQPDVVINNDNIYLSNLFPTLDSKCVRISVVHGYREHFGWDAHKIINVAAIYNHSYIDWIVTISNYMYLGMNNRFRFIKNQLKFLYNGIYPFEELFIPYKIRNNDKEIKILFAGGRKQEKGADILFNAFKKLNLDKVSKLKLFWAGSLPEKGPFSKKGLDKFESIELLGKMNRKDLMGVLAKCHYLIMPSRIEACPMLLLEAMSLGVVPIVSDCNSAMKEIVANANCGVIIKRNNYNALAEAIRGAVNGLSWEENAKRAKEFFYADLHINIYGKKLIELCQTPRNKRLEKALPFPPPNLMCFHRKPYIGSKFTFNNIIQRYRYIYGILKKINLK